MTEILHEYSLQHNDVDHINAIYLSDNIDEYIRVRECLLDSVNELNEIITIYNDLSKYQYIVFNSRYRIKIEYINDEFHIDLWSYIFSDDICYKIVDRDHNIISEQHITITTDGTIQIPNIKVLHEYNNPNIEKYTTERIFIIQK